MGIGHGYTGAHATPRGIEGTKRAHVRRNRGWEWEWKWGMYPKASVLEQVCYSHGQARTHPLVSRVYLTCCIHVKETHTHTEHRGSLPCSRR